KSKGLAMNIATIVISRGCSTLKAIGALLVFGAMFGAATGVSAHDGSVEPAAQAVISTSAVVSAGPLVQVEGTLAVIHTDHFAQGKSTKNLVIHDNNGRDTPVRFANPPPQVGTRLTV